MIIGKRPVEAVARVRQDMLPPAVQLADRSATAWSCSRRSTGRWCSHEEQRPQSVAEFRSALSGLAAPDPGTVTYRTTVKMQDPLQATTPPITFPTGVEFDRDTLKKIEMDRQGISARSPPGDQVRGKKAYTVSGLAEIVDRQTSRRKSCGPRSSG